MRAPRAIPCELLQRRAQSSILCRWDGLTSGNGGPRRLEVIPIESLIGPPEDAKNVAHTATRRSQNGAVTRTPPECDDGAGEKHES